MKGQRFQNITEIKFESQATLDSIMKWEFQRRFQHRERCYIKETMLTCDSGKPEIVILPESRNWAHTLCYRV